MQRANYRQHHYIFCYGNLKNYRMHWLHYSWYSAKTAPLYNLYKMPNHECYFLTHGHDVIQGHIMEIEKRTLMALDHVAGTPQLFTRKAITLQFHKQPIVEAYFYNLPITDLMKTTTPSNPCSNPCSEILLDCC